MPGDERGPFKDLFDFCERIDLKVVSQAAIERLIKAGAFDGLGGHRCPASGRAAAGHAGGRRASRRRRQGQGSLFELSTGAAAPSQP